MATRLMVRLLFNEMQLLGTCNETFSFSRDNVTITGDGNTVIVGHIRIFSSHQVIPSNLSVTGPGPGVTIFNGACVA